MEDEKFISGYCRQIDGSRCVCAELTDGVLESADCAYATCPYAPACPIAAGLDKLK